MKTSKITVNNRQIKSEFKKKILDTDSKNITCTCEEGKDYSERLADKFFIEHNSLKHECNFD